MFDGYGVDGADATVGDFEELVQLAGVMLV